MKIDKGWKKYPHTCTTNSPFICSEIPAVPVSEVYISQVIWYSRVCGSYQDSIDRGLLLRRKLLKNIQWLECWNRQSFAIAIMNWLTISEYPCQRWLGPVISQLDQLHPIGPPAGVIYTTTHCREYIYMHWASHFLRPSMQITADMFCLLYQWSQSSSFSFVHALSSAC